MDKFNKPSEALECGMKYIPEDRLFSKIKVNSTQICGACIVGTIFYALKGNLEVGACDAIWRELESRFSREALEVLNNLSSDHWMKKISREDGLRILKEKGL